MTWLGLRVRLRLRLGLNPSRDSDSESAGPAPPPRPAVGSNLSKPVSPGPGHSDKSHESRSSEPVRPPPGPRAGGRGRAAGSEPHGDHLSRRSEPLQASSRTAAEMMKCPHSHGTSSGLVIYSESDLPRRGSAVEAGEPESRD